VNSGTRQAHQGHPRRAQPAGGVAEAETASFGVCVRGGRKDATLMAMEKVSKVEWVAGCAAAFPPSQASQCVRPPRKSTGSAKLTVEKEWEENGNVDDAFKVLLPAWL